MAEENGSKRRLGLPEVAVIVNFVIIIAGGIAAYSALKITAEINRETQLQFRTFATAQLKEIADKLREHEAEIRVMQVRMAELGMMRTKDGNPDHNP